MKTKIKKNTKTPMLAALLCVLLLIVSMFLPYMTVEEDFRELAEAMEQDPSLSLYDFAVTYLEQNEPAFPTVLGILMGLTVLAALFAIFRKPVLVMLFDIMTTGLAVLIHAIFAQSTRGYAMSIADPLIFTACAGLLISAVWMLAAKVKTKKKAAAARRRAAAMA